MAYILQPLLKIRLMREDRASGELTAARQAREAAEEVLIARQKDLDAYNETREERRDRIYDAIIGQTVTMERLDLATEVLRELMKRAFLRRTTSSVRNQISTSVRTRRSRHDTGSTSRQKSE